MRTAARTTIDCRTAKPATEVMDVAGAVALWILLSVLGWGAIALLIKAL